MEDVKILEWIENNFCNSYGSGSGHGYDDGSGYGCGLGSGSSSGFGSGHGRGSGEGPGSGYGDGYGNGPGDSYGNGAGYGCGDINGHGHGCGYYGGIKSFDDKTVYLIDGVQTIISTIKGNLAKGFVLNSDLSLSPCYICKGNGYFAHGETLKDAREALRGKILKNMNIDETIEQFLSTFEKEKKYPARDFYNWHHYLTGSCEMGRKSFLRDRNIDFEDMYTVDEFIDICKDSFGNEVILKLKEKWENISYIKI